MPWLPGHIRALSLPLALLPCVGFPQNFAAGVPDPPICLQQHAPTTPDGWPNVEASGFYYVDNSDPNATDVNNPYGSRQRPRRSIPGGELAAGSYVELHGGPYVSDRYNTIARGSAAEPVWIRGVDPEAPTIVRTRWLVSGQHLVIENLKFDSSRTGLGLVGSNAVCVRSNVFAGPGLAVGNSAVIFVGAGSGGAKSGGNVIYNNVIHDFGDRTSARENDYHGILVGRNAESTWILENEIFNNGGDAIQVGQTNLRGDERPQFVFIARNRMYGNRENAVDIKRARDVIVSSNEIHDYMPTSSSEGAGIVIHNDPEHIWILNNVISNSEFGAITTGSKDTWFIGNLIYDIRTTRPVWKPNSGYNSGAAMHFRGDSSGGAIGNTIVWYDVGLQLSQGSDPGYIVQNNIFAFRMKEAGDDIYVASGDFSQALTISHNLYYGSTTAFKSTWAGRSYDSLARLQRDTGQFGASLTADPVFVDAEHHDFRLCADSPAIGAGTRSVIPEDFRARYDIGLDDDYSIQGSGPEPVIGAYPRAGPENSTHDVR